MSEITKEPLVSIIVPVYNVKDYLNDFFLSLDNLTYKNIEIILVDDGSNDGSEKLLDEYALKNKKVVLVHKKNSGVADTRNLALSMYKGDYVYFADPDDFFHPDIITIMMKEMLENDVDVVISKAIAAKWNSHYNSIKLNNKSKIKRIDGVDKIYSYLLSERFSGYGIWNKIFKRELFSKVENYPNIFDRKCLYGDDILMQAKYFVNCHSCIFIDKPMYYCRRRKGSITKSKFKEGLLTANMDEKFYETLDKNVFKESQIYIKSRISMENIDLIFRIYKSDYNNKEKISEIYRKYVDNIKYCKYGKLNPWFRRYFMWFPRPFIYLMIRKRMK